MTGLAPGDHEQLRSECYRLLSICFFPPDRDRLLGEDVCRDLADALHALYPETGAAARAAALHDHLLGLSALDLRVEHAALFVGPFALEAPPYGSVYLEEGRALMGDTTLAAEARYRAAGLTVTLVEPADHVGVELEFMHYLTALAADARVRGDDAAAAALGAAQDEFLAEHLGAWGPAFCAAVARGAESPFYRTLAECLRSFLEAEMQRAPAMPEAAA